ncbi:MAG: citramalate synthase [Ardenticatenaceae bacterium]|nr:citramalate synthase [Ardenticatenaceae bacterium]
MSNQVFIYDTTLRDGTQREGISYSLEDKIKIAQKLDEFGVHYIEGGWPGSNPKDVDFFRRAQTLKLKTAKITAFGSTRRKNTDPAEDANIKALLDAQTPVVTIFGKSWDLHVLDVLETTMDENLAMIGESVAYCKQQGREVIYDAEHFFDGYKANPEYALATVQTAAINGASSVVLCDTNGGNMPWEIEEIVREVKGQMGDTPLGIHTHDDSGCGVANTLAAVKAGANQVQGTINGYGERVANANLCSVIPDLQLKMGFRCVSDENLAKLRDLSRYISEIANLDHDEHLPYVGASAFAHKGGVHVAAMLRNENSYQHINPELVGNERRSVVSELSGRGNLVEKSEQMGLNISKERLTEVLQQIKELENRGFTFEGAEASVELMLRRAQPSYVPIFELKDMMVVMLRRKDGRITAEATVKVRVGHKTMHTAASGNGPVNALDKALRKALVDVYPRLKAVKLVDYKVRILDSENATAATTRVLIDSRMGDKSWSTVGASPNIIDASWQALSDSMEYALLI